ncbi:MAG: hypothetical protein ACOVQE_00280 [Chitinophagaceae bacterium]
MLKQFIYKPTFKYLFFSVLVILSFCHVLFCFASFGNNDDINYARFAADWSYNNYVNALSTNHYELRWVIILCTAFFYKLLGVTVFSSLLCNYLSLLLTGYLLFQQLKKASLFVFLLGLSLYFGAHSIIFNMHRLLPDATMCTLVFALFLLYQQVLQNNFNTKKIIIIAFQFAFVGFLAVGTKETVIIVAPLFLFYAINNYYRKQFRRFWLFVLGFFVLFMALYLGYFKIMTGSFWYRLTILYQNSYVNECSYDVLPITATIKRITYLLIRDMLLKGDMLVYIPALVACIHYKRMPNNRLLIQTFTILFLLSNFMTISFKHYVPLCHDPRHFLFLFPFAAIIGAQLLYQYVKNPKAFLLLPIVYLIVFLILFYLKAGNTKWLYLMLFLILILVYWLKQKQIVYRKVAVLSGVFCLFILNYAIDVWQPFYPTIQEVGMLVEKHFSNQHKPAIIYIEDAFLGEMGEFYLQFKKPSIQFKPINQLNLASNNTINYVIDENNRFADTTKSKIDTIAQLKQVALYQLR